MILGISTLVETAAGVTATRTGDGVLLNMSKGQDVLFRLDAVKNGGTTPTLDVKIQHAPTTSGVFTDLVSFAQVTTTDGSFEVHIPSASMSVLPCVRAVGTLGGTSPDYSYTVKAFTN